MKLHLRIVTPLVVFVGLAACSSGTDEMQPQADDGAEVIECALGEGSEFGPNCLVERQEVDGQTMLTVRHQDGGFRRFKQLDDGRGLSEVDGADQAIRSLEDGRLLISIGADQYRFAADVQESAAPAEAEEPLEALEQEAANDEQNMSTEAATGAVTDAGSEE